MRSRLNFFRRSRIGARCPASPAVPSALVLLMLWMSGAATAAVSHVLFIAPSAASPYSEVVASFEEAMEGLCGGSETPCLAPKIEVVFAQAPDSEIEKLSPADSLVIALGAETAGWLATQDWTGKSVFALIPSQSYRRLVDCCIPASMPQTALFLDQPPGRTLDLASALLPDGQRVALLTSPGTKSLEDEFQAAVNDRGLTLVTSTAESSEEVGPSLKQLFDGTDALVAIADNRLYNSTTIYSVLLSTYRERIPVIGFSSSLVKAGALASVYSSPQDVGQELATLVWPVVTFGAYLPAPAYPVLYSIEMNDQVARSFGISLPGNEQVRKSLEAAQ